MGNCTEGSNPSLSVFAVANTLHRLMLSIRASSSISKRKRLSRLSISEEMALFLANAPLALHGCSFKQHSNESLL